jgi:protein-L-isoaspartate(D-aspartate) O-methyltransferase
MNVFNHGNLEKQCDHLRDIMVARQLARRDITNSIVLEAMRKVPRHRFIPPELRSAAYDDAPQSIGFGQTISQPYVVASMTQNLRLQKTDRVLEIGTGSGYQTAVLAELCEHVWTIECVPELYERGKRLLAELGYHTVRMRMGNGAEGWPEEAPFDAIIVTAAAAAVPAALTAQLAESGRMIIPVESSTHDNQDLVLIEKHAGYLSQTILYPVRFVPLSND